MPSLRSLIDPGGGSLGFHVRRLQTKLEGLRQRLREATARLLGETVANVVEQVVHRMLDPAGVPDPDPPRRPRDYEPNSPLWHRPDVPDYDYDPDSAYLHE